MNSIARKLLYTLLTLTGLVFLVGSALKSVAAPEVRDKCPVCHNGTNPHTVFIKCSEVNNYLAGHPGDYAGPCQNVTNEKPPKPTPTP
jgi:hypothetical protein